MNLVGNLKLSARADDYVPLPKVTTSCWCGPTRCPFHHDLAGFESCVELRGYFIRLCPSKLQIEFENFVVGVWCFRNSPKRWVFSSPPRQKLVSCTRGPFIVKIPIGGKRTTHVSGSCSKFVLQSSTLALFLAVKIGVSFKQCVKSQLVND